MRFICYHIDQWLGTGSTCTHHFPNLRGVEPTDSMCYPLVACHGGITLRGDIELSKDSKALLAIRLSQREAANSQGMNFQSTGGLVVQ